MNLLLDFWFLRAILAFVFQGRIARKPKGSKDFTRRTAEESFRSLVKTHDKYGWVTPPLADG